MKDILHMCEHFLRTPWIFLLWKDVIEWISNEKLHLCEQGLTGQGDRMWTGMTHKKIDLMGSLMPCFLKARSKGLLPSLQH